jgi:ESF2/ABP1 family protein
MARSSSEDESHPDEEEHSESVEDSNQIDSEEEEQVHSDGNDVMVAEKKPKKVHRLSLTETENFNEKLKKRGVLYIARIPPKMTPTKIKSLLSEFCEVTRVYLVQEDASVRKRRKKEHGRSGGKRYTEGWVEMSSKKKAKRVALSLNNAPISNHKRNPHYGTKA